ncbi:class III aminotransferase [Klebsiella pneumoniae]|nr:class III aminotransferase [Klebsiella pneumoniae]
MLPVLVMLRRLQLTAWLASHSETATARRYSPQWGAITVRWPRRFSSRRHRLALPLTARNLLMNNKTPILQLNRFDALTGVADENLSRQIARRHATQGTGSVLFYPQPIVMASASGAWMEDSAGNRYLDMYNNVPGVGHCHPHITQAMVAPGRVTEHQHPLSVPGTGAVRGQPAGDVPRRAVECDIYLHRQREQRHRPADGPLYQWSAGDHRHRECLSRQYNGGDGGLSLRAQRGPSCPRGCIPFPPLTCAGCQRARRCLTSSPPTLSAPWTSWMSGLRLRGATGGYHFFQRRRFRRSAGISGSGGSPRTGPGRTVYRR